MAVVQHLLNHLSMYVKWSSQKILATLLTTQQVDLVKAVPILRGNLVDFAASDSVYTSGFPAQLEYAAVYAAGIAIGYNLPTVKTPIYLSPAVIAQIFSGEIQNWNDVRIRTVNDGEVKVPVFATKKVTVKVGGKNTTQTVPVLDKAGKPKILKYNTVEANAKPAKSANNCLLPQRLLWNIRAVW